jgi:hypothetical protein
MVLKKVDWVTDLAKAGVKTQVIMSPKLLEWARSLGFFNLSRHCNEWLYDWCLRMEDVKRLRKKGGV